MSPRKSVSAKIKTKKPLPRKNAKKSSLGSSKVWIIVALVVACGWGYYTWQQGNKNKSTFAVFGDCIAQGALADPIKLSFADRTAEVLNSTYHNINLQKFGLGGITTPGYAAGINEVLQKVDQNKYGPMKRAVLLIGLNDLTTIYEGCPDCTFKATYAQGVACSYNFKKQLQTIIDAILKKNPSCRLVLCTIPDPNNNGAGTCDAFKPFGLIKEFNKRVIELGKQDHLRVADFYAALIGHTDWFSSGGLHPNNAGHLIMSQVLEDQFGVGPNSTPESTENPSTK